MDRINRRELLALLAASGLRAQNGMLPSIVFILADDLGYGDVGCYGQKKILTPCIDRLAAEGMRFTDAYAGAAVCAPSRCCLMTGMDTGHARIRGNFSSHRGRVPLRPDDVTVAEVLKTAGYRTGIFGKWGLGEAGTFGIPNDQGFDEWVGFLNQDHALDYYPNELWHNRTDFFPAGNQGVKHTEYAQDIFTKHALNFLDSSANQPFFLYLAYTLPHASSEIGRQTGDGYIVPDYKPYEDRSWPRPEKGYAAMVTRLDTDVGRVVERVRSLGIESNTLIMFASDNGPSPEGGHKLETFSSAGPLRGRKSTLYEGGIRIPLIARWPNRIPAGAVAHQPCAFWDMLPTFAELAGVPVPRGIDGLSIAPTLFGREQPQHKYFYWESFEKGFQQAVRLGSWKGVRQLKTGDAIELYNLETDLAEQHDVAAEHPDLVKQIAQIMQEARVDSPDYRIPAGNHKQ